MARLLSFAAPLLLAAAAGASEPNIGPTGADVHGPPRAGRYSLGLEAPLLARETSIEAFEHPSADHRTAGADRAPAITLGDIRTLVAANYRQDPDPADPAPTSAPSNGGFGRWLKRHWWVPALVGAAVLATAGETLYDDDGDNDDED